MKLFAVLLGGRAPKANTELHDVVFVVGKRIMDTFGQLRRKWFGAQDGLHIDSWIELDVVDGWRVLLAAEPRKGKEKLYFVNLGAYLDGSFTELHAVGFYVATSANEAKARAKAELFRKGEQTVHKDDLHEIDDCIAVGRVDDAHIALMNTGETSALKPNNGYLLLP